MSLAFQIFFASAFTLIIKWVHSRQRENVLTVGAINYIVAAACALPFFLQLPPSPVFKQAIITGGSMGLVYFIAFFYVIYCVKHIGASITTVVSVLSLLFPIVLAAVIWSEFPDTLQCLGIVLAIVALLLISIRRSQDAASVNAGSNHDSGWSKPLALLVFFVLCGCSRLAQETFKHISESNQRPAFLFSAFGVTACLSLANLLYQRQKISANEIALGILMGVSNVLQTQFILKSLERFPGYIVFPVTSAGAIVLTTLVATSVFGEQIEKKALVGISFAVLSLFVLA